MRKGALALGLLPALNAHEATSTAMPARNAWQHATLHSALGAPRGTEREARQVIGHDR
jgi:hypothetical protein